VLTKTLSQWISGAEARRRLGIGRKGLAALVEAGRLSERRVLADRPRYLAEEVERIAMESTRSAAKGAAPSMNSKAQRPRSIETLG